MVNRRKASKVPPQVSQRGKSRIVGSSPDSGVNVSEFGAIDIIKRTLQKVPSVPNVSVGIGDDATVLRVGAGELVCSVDSNVEGVHFDLNWISIEGAANRAYHAAASDLAAMGAAPLAAVVALELPKGTSPKTIAAVAKGQARAVRETGCPLVGGNIVRGARFGFTTTVLGTCPRGSAATRDGARPGDEIWLSHEVGWAGLGLQLLQSQDVVFTKGRYLTGNKSPRWAHLAVKRWCSPVARIATGQVWRTRVNAMIDISDSLASEAQHLAKASGVRLVLDGALLEAMHQPLFRAAQTLEREPWDLILYGGEDYALLATGSPRRRPPGVHVIGHVERGRGAVLERNLSRVALSRGFDHLSD